MLWTPTMLCRENNIPSSDNTAFNATTLSNAKGNNTGQPLRSTDCASDLTDASILTAEQRLMMFA